MKRFFLGAATAAVSVMVVLFEFVSIVDCYATRYDHIDLDTILNNRRMVNYFAACLLSTGTCPPQGVELKRILPEALGTNCALCTEKQRVVAYRSIKRLKKEYPKIWSELSALWDPDGSIIDRFEKSFESSQPPKSTVSSIVDRFGDAMDETNANTISTDDDKPTSPSIVTTPRKPSIVTSTSPMTTTTVTTSTIRTSPTSTTTRITTKLIPSLSPTNKQITTKRPTLSPLGTNIQATVSYGVNAFNGFVTSLSELGRGVVETGAKLADAVVKVVVGGNIQ